MRQWRFRERTPAQQKRHDAWLPRFDGDWITNGCLEADDYAEAIREELAAESVSINYTATYAAGDMPVVKWDAAFEEWLHSRCAITDTLRNERLQNLLPWDALKALPADRKKGDTLYFSQGSMPSCMGHADAFALASSTISGIALGLPLVYEPFNPIVTWAISKGGSTRGGQNVSAMAKASNGIGHFPISAVGGDNQRVPSYKNAMNIAEKHQAGIVFIPGRGGELAHKITRCCRAGLGVACGNSTAVRGATTDANGVKVAVLGGSWAHACLCLDQPVYTGQGAFKAGELIGKQFFVLSYSKRLGRVAVKRAIAVLSGEKQCVRITTNVGTFHTSYDHPFMLRTGKLKKAFHLKKYRGGKKSGEDSMMRGCTFFDEKGYIRVSIKDGNNSKKKLHQLIGWDILGAGDNLIVHHLDENVLNNSIENLVLLNRAAHSAIHRFNQTFDEESQVKKSATLRECYKDGRFGKGHKAKHVSPHEIEKYKNRYKEKKDGRNLAVHVIDIEILGMQPVVSVQVLDPEPDDKRDFSEHNYMIVPVESNRYAVDGVFVGNTSFTGYRTISAAEYVFWVNSHGKRYGSSGEGEPADGAWMRTEKELTQFCGTMSGYGQPYAVLPEAVIVKDVSHRPTVTVPFPANWRG